MSKTTWGIALVALIGIAIGSYVVWGNINTTPMDSVDPTPRSLTVSGTYECLPHKNTSGPQTMECAFGLKADDGKYYAVNFGASAGAMEQFMAGARVTLEGVFVPREALSTNEWNKYNMEGILTPSKVTPTGSGAQGKIDINAVCEGALAYMTFPDGASAEAFVAECKEGKHPEVIDRYIEGLGVDGAQI